MLRMVTAAWPAGLWFLYGYFAWRYRLGTAISPGPGLFPFSLAILGLIIGLLLIVTHQGGNAGRQPVVWKGEKRVAVFAFLMALNVLLTPWIGQVCAIGVFTILTARLMGIRQRGRLLAIGIGTPAAIFLIFGYLLETPLIEGQIISFLRGF